MDSIDEVLEAARSEFAQIKAIYEKTLTEKEPRHGLRPKIKSCLEHLRSSLDYLAVRIANAYGKQGGMIYYPLAQKPEEFEGQMHRRLPGVLESRPDIAGELEKYQPYNTPWLARLNKLTRFNKHNDLSPQTRVEWRRRKAGGVEWDPSSVTFHEGGGITVGSGGGGLVVGPGGGGVVIGPGGTHIAGERVDPTTQRTPSTQDIIYVDWLFTDLNASVRQTLLEFLAKVPPTINTIRHVAAL